MCANRSSQERREFSFLRVWLEFFVLLPLTGEATMPVSDAARQVRLGIKTGAF